MHVGLPCHLCISVVSVIIIYVVSHMSMSLDTALPDCADTLLQVERTMLVVTS
jgi:hypothetical protein